MRTRVEQVVTEQAQFPLPLDFNRVVAQLQLEFPQEPLDSLTAVVMEVANGLGLAVSFARPNEEDTR